MDRPRLNNPVRPLLDRFLNPEETGRPDFSGYLAMVLRDLGALLNTRSAGPALGAADRGPETVLDYGLPDFTRAQARRQDDVLRLALAVKRVVETFEPRLTRVRVEPLEPEPGLAGEESLTLLVAARLTGYEERPEVLLEVPVHLAPGEF